MNSRIFGRVEGLALLALFLGACEPQVTPDYLGRKLLAMRGHVEIETDRREALEPVLTFFQPQTSQLHVIDVEVEGKFPSDFSIEVYQPPPPQAMQHLPGGPPFAIGHLAAMAERGDPRLPQSPA